MRGSRVYRHSHRQSVQRVLGVLLLVCAGCATPRTAEPNLKTLEIKKEVAAKEPIPALERAQRPTVEEPTLVSVEALEKMIGEQIESTGMLVPPIPRPKSGVVPATFTSTITTLQVKEPELPPPLPATKADPIEPKPPVLPPPEPVNETKQNPPVEIAPAKEPGLIKISGKTFGIDALSQIVDASEQGYRPSGGCESCGNGRQCAPGQAHCDHLPQDGHFPKVIAAIYEAVCCPDPCYQPKWTPLADAAFFADAARPVSQTRLRWEYFNHMQFPDRGEFFWARGDGKGKGPKTTSNVAKSIPHLDAHELVQYTETATGAFSASVSTPYRSLDPALGKHAAGFGDITLGTKTLLLDSELLLVAFQMRTTLPSGNFLKGHGAGHVSLEPSVLIGLQVSEKCYLQAQVAEWIPLGGDNDYAGALLHHHFSLNYLLWKPIPSIQLVGTMEWNGYSFQDGAYTDPVFGSFQRASGKTLIQLGPGIRLFFCDKLDFGIGNVTSVTGKYMARDQMRFEFRYRF
ncbi:MAG: transporter [Planctomycetes bacterium]|nr:transporter [Planctomycetota bacterium]